MPRKPADPLAEAKLCTTPAAWLALVEPLYAQHRLALGQVATNAHDEALYLILHTLGLPLDSDAQVLTRRISPGDHRRLAGIFRRRILDRVPAAYLTREAWLGDYRFYVDERAIIPRSYFLELVPQALTALLPARTPVRRAADVCTGSGCLAILLAHAFPDARIDACDLSPAALEVAKINVGQHHVGRRVALWQSDVFAAVPPASYDLIISNPPYEPSDHVDRQAPEFAAEPRLAHDGGRDGLGVIRKVLEQARGRLQPHGLLAIEVGGLRRATNREFGALQPQWLRTQDGSNCVVAFRAADLLRRG